MSHEPGHPPSRLQEAIQWLLKDRNVDRKMAIEDLLAQQDVTALKPEPKNTGPVIGPQPPSLASQWLDRPTTLGQEVAVGLSPAGVGVDAADAAAYFSRLFTGEGNPLANLGLGTASLASTIIPGSLTMVGKMGAPGGWATKIPANWNRNELRAVHHPSPTGTRYAYPRQATRNMFVESAKASDRFGVSGLGIRLPNGEVIEGGESFDLLWLKAKELDPNLSDNALAGWRAWDELSGHETRGALRRIQKGDVTPHPYVKDDISPMPPWPSVELGVVDEAGNFLPEGSTAARDAMKKTGLEGISILDMDPGSMLPPDEGLRKARIIMEDLLLLDPDRPLALMNPDSWKDFVSAFHNDMLRGLSRVHPELVQDIKLGQKATGTGWESVKPFGRFGFGEDFPNTMRNRPNWVEMLEW